MPIIERRSSERLIRESYHSPRETVRQLPGQCLGEHFGQSAVIPACAFSAAVEPLPERLAQDAIVKEYCFGIVGFVGKRDKQGLRGLRWQLREVRFLPRSPFRFRMVHESVQSETISASGQCLDIHGARCRLQAYVTWMVGDRNDTVPVCSIVTEQGAKLN
jgi:hypothetical protein